MDITQPNNSLVPKTQERVRLKVNAKKIITIASIVFVVAVIAAGVAGWRSGLFTSADALRGFLEHTGALAPIVFLLIQILQVVIPVIPGGVTCAVGVIAFGPVYGLIYNYLGLVIGSTLVFLIARKFGMPLIKSIVSPKTFDKYAVWLDKSQPLFNKLIAAAIFLPFFPDDIICMIAGVSKMKLSTFLLINIVLKLPFLLPYSFGLPTILSWFGR